MLLLNMFNQDGWQVKMKNIFLVICLFGFVFSSPLMEDGEIYKQKEELKQLKIELNNFYDKKEQEYQKHKQELAKIEQKTTKELQEIKSGKEQNQKILNEIKQIKVSKAIAMYNKMPVKVVLKIFNKNIADGKIDEVFDIITKMKTKQVMNVLKKMDAKSATILMNRLTLSKGK